MRGAHYTLSDLLDVPVGIEERTRACPFTYRQRENQEAREKKQKGKKKTKKKGGETVQGERVRE